MASAILVLRMQAETMPKPVYFQPLASCWEFPLRHITALLRLVNVRFQEANIKGLAKYVEISVFMVLFTVKAAVQ